MRGKIKSARKEASKLHGAQATWVSLVDAGANETPFTLIKSKAGVKAMGIKKRKTPVAAKTAQKKSHKPLSTAKKTGDSTVETKTETLIAKMVFDAEVFESEEEVRTYLKEAEWEAEDIAVIQNGDGDWEARSDDLTDDDFDKIAKVDTDEDGVEAYVGTRTVELEVKSEDDEDEDEDGDEEEISTETKTEAEDEDEDDLEPAIETKDADEVTDEEKSKGKKKPTYSKRQEFMKRRKEAKAQETLAKFDMWDARFSKANTLAKALKDGLEYDATPPGYVEVQAAFNAAVGNIIGGEGLDGTTKQEALNKAASDYAEIIGGLDTFFDAYVEADPEVVEKAITDEGERAALVKWAESFADFAAGEITAPETVVKTAGDAATIDYSKVTETVQDIIAKALDPLTQRIDGVSETVEALSTRAPTKKAAAPEDGGSAGPRTVKQKAGASKEDEATDRFAKSFLG